MKIKNSVFVLAVFPVLVFLGCGKDEDQVIVAPTIVSSTPVDDATGIAIASTIEFNFLAAMDPQTMNSTTVVLMEGTTEIATAVAYDNNKVTMTPTAELANSTEYTATVNTGAESALGVALENDFTITFTTVAVVDNEAPVVSSKDPLSDATGVARDKTVSVVFNEPMDPATISATTFTLVQGITAVAGTVSYADNTATFTADANLESKTTYTATITTGVQDLFQNGLATATTWSFTTLDDAAPFINSTSPLSDATGVARNKTVSIMFNESMNLETINATTFTLKKGTTPVAGVVAYADNTATFTSTTILESNTVYTAEITTGAQDLSGNGLATATTWNFTTSNVTATLAVVNLGEASNYVILAKTAINNSSTSAITGHLGLSPAATSYITGLSLTDATGYATSAQVTGNVYAADMADPTPINLTTAVNDMITAYNDAAGRPTPEFLELGTGNIGGMTLSAGLYKWTSTVTIPSDVTLTGGADDVWIFQISGDLSQSTAINVTLNGGAQAKNIFWQVAGEATFGANSHFEGNILSKTGITFLNGASINGRTLAQTAVILDANAVTKVQ
ncbi:ice-binding family protein [Reichenbachiella sp. MALMAid0571]|uniref:ice-binding family protein n=1 Tax=Reichenbachiella sp. MALMAid0571 TaxID=3143939 RepID=UPI0032DE8C95